MEVSNSAKDVKNFFSHSLRKNGLPFQYFSPNIAFFK